MRKKILRSLFVVAGTVSLGMGVAGIFLPLVPTTPFLLLASACYVRGSQRLHGWLLNHGRLGAYLRDFEAGRGMPLRAKVVVIAMLWGSVGISVYRLEMAVVEVILMAGAAGVTTWIVRMPTIQPAP